MDLNNLIKKTISQAIQIRRYLHQHPELSEQEGNTADYICNILEQHHISYQRNIAGNGIIAVVGNENSGKCVGIRADIDALPVEEHTGLPYASINTGVMHACGHDMHTAILLGAGIVLKDAEEELNGCVKLIFQPAEETVGGAAQMIAEGALNAPEIDAMIALHIDPSLETGDISLKNGAINAAVNGFYIDINGKQCHGAHPETGIDPIVTASSVVLNLQSLVSRFTAPTTPIVVTIGEIRAGTCSNIIPETCRLHGTLRTLDNETTEFAKKSIRRIAENTAKAYDASAEVHFDNDPFPALINNATIVSAVETAACEMKNLTEVHHLEASSMGGDDFAFFTEKVPGAYFNLGCTKPGCNPVPLHSDNLAPDEDSIELGIELEVRTVMKLLEE